LQGHHPAECEVTIDDSGTMNGAVIASTTALPFGRVLVGDEVHHALLDGETVVLLDRPAYDPAASVVGSAPLAACTILAPVEPGKVVAVGLNYRAHAAEFDMPVPVEPILFMKPSTAVIGPGESIVCPARSARVDYEAELALVVGRHCKDLTPSTAAQAVAGYICGNDVTARDLQGLDGQWTRSKSFDTFCPLGPWAVRDAPPPTARVSASIDGALVQEGLIGDMIVTPLDLLVFVSGVMTLLPGDVIMTGTPPGVGPVKPGQTVTISVAGVGELSNPVA
jgi:2-keto-4-pentenoate hydratase/2-oxohepta-3-ene-1,7-dioic acid hydratase in catechol pathway